MRYFSTGYNNDMCFLLLVVMAFGFAFPECLAQEEKAISKSDLEKAQSLVEGYLENQKKISRYAVALRVEYSREYFDGSGRDFSKQDWYLHTVDREKDRVRHDDIVTQMVATQDGVNFREAQFPISMFFEKGKARQVVGNALGNVLSEEIDAKELEESFKKQTNFDPWDLPVTGWEVFAHRRSLKPFKSTFLEKAKVLAVEQVANYVHVTFHCAKGVVCNVEFDTRSGSMPTSVELEVHDGAYDGVISAIRTKWKAFQKTNWVPVEVLVVKGSGPPGDFKEKITGHFFASWVIGDAFPDFVFSQRRSNNYSPYKLKSTILRHAHVTAAQ